MDPDREALMEICRRSHVPCAGLLDPVVASDDRAWEGIVERAEIRAGATAVDYAAPGVLTIPARRWEFREDPNITFYDLYPWDLLVNVIGFIPLGFLLALDRRVVRWPGVLGSVACVAFVVSLGIETIQFFLPARMSAFPDIVTNVMGAVIGGVLASRLRTHKEP